MNNNANLLLNQANFQYSQGKYQEAVSLYRKIIKIDKKNSIAFNNLAMALENLGKTKKAVFYLKKAVSLSSFASQPWRNLGLFYNKLGQHQKALTCFEKSVRINPSYSLGLLDLGITANFLGEKQKAEEAFLKLCQIEKNSPWPLHNLASFYIQNQEFEKAEEALKKCLAIDPHFSPAVNNFYLLYRKMCDFEKAEIIEPKLDKTEEDPYVSLIRTEDEQKNYQAARNWAQKIEQNLPKIKFSYPPKKDKKIRLGFLSYDFGHQSAGGLASPLFQYFDKNQFEIYLYFSSPKEDSLTQLAKKSADKSLNIGLLSDLDAAKTINSHQIDILVDLSGYTLGQRLAICALRPAPVQVAYLGFSGSTGASFFNYNLVDEIVVPKESQKYYSEKLIYLSGCYQPYFFPEKINPKRFSRKDFGLPETGFIFSSFNQPYKFEPVMFNVWLEILKEVPDSILWLPYQKEVEKNLQNFAQKKGVSPKRLVFSKRLPTKKEHLERLSLSDLGLDTYIFGGHITTSDYLFAEVPVISRKGNHLISRISSSILINFGLEKMVANDLNEYKKMAVFLAQNPNKLEETKEKIRQKKQEFFNPKAFAEKLEKAFLEIWKNYSK